MKLDDRQFRHNPDILTRRIQNGLALIHVPTNKYYELNSTAARLWELTGAGYPLTDIYKRLVSEYEVEEEELVREVDDMVRQLQEHDLLQPKPDERG